MGESYFPAHASLPVEQLRVEEPPHRHFAEMQRALCVQCLAKYETDGFATLCADCSAGLMRLLEGDDA